MDITTKSTIAGGINLHFRTSGEGPPLILLHASPMSSAAMIPMIEKFSSNYTVYALDTPGYGYSEPFNHDPESLAEYTQVIHDFIVQLNTEKVSIYGSATGAQLAIRYGINHPENVHCLFLDNVAHFDDEMVEGVMQHYFPDLTPTEDGKHLSNAWNICSGLFKFFPWCFQEEKYKLNLPPMPIHVLHATMRDFVWTGAGYDKAYRLAFKHEKIDNILALEVPVTILRWENSIIKPHSDRIFEENLPDNIGQFHIGSGENRIEAIFRCICTNYSANLPASNPTSKFESVNLSEHSYDMEVLGDFPTMEVTGDYWMEAWNRINAFYPSMKDEEKNKVLFYWSEMNEV